MSVNGIVRMRSGGAPIDLAACGGISSVEDLLMAVVAGADAVMMTSEIYRSGPVVVTHILEGLATFLARHKIASFDKYKKLRKPPKLYRGMFVRPTDDSEATSQQSTHYPTGNGYGHPLT
ncbi:MAG: hypothetical protein D6753_13610 [Planctomycetota bacterium]|nr:MAG: hypothetical protein D6753_13610 [Planctomycetota bacterium]